MKLNDRARAFIKGLTVSRQAGIADLAILAHAWLESGGFSRVIGSYNAWGVKVPKRTPWSGKVFYVPTTEYSRAIAGETAAQALPRMVKLWGQPDVKVLGLVKGMWKLGLKQGFIDFNTQGEAIAWYCDFIQRLYPLSLVSRNEPTLYFNGLVGRGPVDRPQQGRPYQVIEQIPGKLIYATDPDYVSELLALKNSLERDADVKAALAAVA